MFNSLVYFIVRCLLLLVNYDVIFWLLMLFLCWIGCGLHCVGLLVYLINLDLADCWDFGCGWYLLL